MGDILVCVNLGRPYCCSTIYFGSELHRIIRVSYFEQPFTICSVVIIVKLDIETTPNTYREIACSFSFSFHVFINLQKETS